MVRQNGFNEYQSSFSELCNSGNSAITVKGKGLTNVKMYTCRKKFFQKVKFHYKATLYQVSVV